jgi:hypothetical protein
MELEIATAFGGNKKFPIIRRYAENVSARYATALPRGLETVLFAEIIKTAALGAFASLYENVRSADALGHPAVLTNDVDWNHTPPPPRWTLWTSSDSCWTCSIPKKSTWGSSRARWRRS